MGYSSQLAARVLLYASSHRQDNIPRNLLHQSWSSGWNEKLLNWSTMNALTTALYLAPAIKNAVIKRVDCIYIYTHSLFSLFLCNIALTLDFFLLLCMSSINRLYTSFTKKVSYYIHQSQILGVRYIFNYNFVYQSKVSTKIALFLGPICTLVLHVPYFGSNTIHVLQ